MDCPSPPPDSRQVSRTFSVHLAGGVSLLAWAGLAWASWNRPTSWEPLGLVWALTWLAGAWVWWRTRPPGTDVSPIPIFGWALLFRLCGLFSQPVLEDDQYRYLWDGRQLVETGNPYALPPSAFFDAASLPPDWIRILDQVNYPQVPTVYGPVCQYAFGLSYWVAPGQLWPWRLILWTAEAVVIALLVRTSGWRAGAFAAWCPLAILEVSFNVHPDLLGVALLIAGIVLTRPAPRTFPWGGLLLGLAVATKITALVLVPFVLMRRSAREGVGLIAGVMLAYLPFWLQGSTAEWGGLRTFAAEWEFNSAAFALLQGVGGADLARLLSGVCFVGLWLLLLWLWSRPDKIPASSDWPPGDAVFGTLLLFSSTVNPWYLLWILPFAARRRTATATMALAAVGLSYLTGNNLGRTDLGPFDHPVWVRPLEFGLIALAAIFDLYRGRLKARATRPDSTPD